MDGNTMPGIRVLIVDDMAQVRQDLRTVLPLAGNAAGLSIEIVGEAVNGQEAIRRAEALQPDVVLMDLAMPVTDGYAATQAIKDGNPSIRVVALTVLDYPTAGEKARLAGVDGFIEKGASVAEIIQTIRKTLSGKILSPENLK
jgi:DNA-binding NarL/FixJ family response regulator